MKRAIVDVSKKPHECGNCGRTFPYRVASCGDCGSTVIRLHRDVT